MYNHTHDSWPGRVAPEEVPPDEVLPAPPVVLAAAAAPLVLTVATVPVVPDVPDVDAATDAPELVEAVVVESGSGTDPEVLLAVALLLIVASTNPAPELLVALVSFATEPVLPDDAAAVVPELVLAAVVDESEPVVPDELPLVPRGCQRTPDTGIRLGIRVSDGQR